MNLCRGKILCLLVLSATSTLSAQKKTEGFHFTDNIPEKQIALTWNDTLVTSYYYADSIRKPILFPVNTVSGITVTRGFPIAPRPGEHTDHPHHTGVWMNYEYVNGLDFWNNSTAIPLKNRSHYGTILHDGVVRADASKSKAVLEVTARWVTPEKKILVRESTRYDFTVEGKTFIIDRTTTLAAFDEEVKFNDVKDGFFAIRVTRELEHPATEPEVYVDNKGNASTVPALNNEGVTGEYISSEGLRGNAVWGTRARWVTLFGRKHDKEISVTIIDHPNNINYPTYWHARGYGLFAANPLGSAVFSKGKEKLNFVLNAGESKTFRYRMVIHEGGVLNAEAIDKLAAAFSTTAEQR